MQRPVKAEPIDLAREPSFVLGGAQIRPATREAAVGAETEILEPRVMQVLVALYRSRGEVVSREELTARCWGGRVVGDDAINRTIARLRRLSETHGGFRLETIPRVGHRLLETVEAVPSPEMVAEAIVTPESPLSKRRALWPFVAIVVLAILIAAGAAWRLWPSPKPLVVQSPRRLSIAVLPFTPLYTDPEGRNFGDAIATAVSDLLSSGTRFTVVSPERSSRFRGGAKADIALALHADFLIEGEVRHMPDGVSVAVRLIDGADSTTLRSATVQVPQAEAAKLPDYVATEVAGFGWSAALGFTSAARWDHHVWAVHLRALHLTLSTHDAFTAYDLLHRLAEENPDDAFAQTDYGLAAAILLSSAPQERKPEILAQARAAAQKAISLDPRFGDPYAVLFLTTPMYDWSVGEDLLRKSAAMVPGAFIGLGLYAEYLPNAGRFRDGGQVAEAIYAILPFQDGVISKAASTRIWLGQIPQAWPLIERGMNLFTRKQWFFAKAFEATAFNGDLAGAEHLLNSPLARQVFAPDAPPVLYSRIVAGLRYHRPADSAAVADICSKASTQTLAIVQTCLMGLASLGRIDDAFRLAAVIYPDQSGATLQERTRKLLTKRYIPTAHLFVPATASMRADPRFADVAERIGLMAYWKSTKRYPDFCRTENVPVCRALRR